MNESAGRKHLLIVDDEPVILQILKAVFEDEPVRLTCVGTGNDAKRVLEEQGCDLLITDKNLPDINGLELLKLAKQLNRFTEVIIITGYASLETALMAMEHDAFDYVVKPLNNVFDIRNKIRRALEKQNMAMENERLLGDLRDRNEALQSALDDAQALQAELIQSEKLAGIGTLAAGVAHEISSPLFGILGLSEAIPSEEDREKVDAYANEIATYCGNIRSIVVDLSGYSRASAEHSEPVNVTEVLSDAIRLVQRAVDVSDLEMTVEVASGLSTVGRSTEVQQVFVNLIKNAIEAVRDQHGSSGSGRVEITAGKGIDHVWATVEDNGVGIPEEVQSRVFDPFYTTKPPGKGTGLGLNVAYRIMTKHRGHISLRESETGGTAFRIQFPQEE